MPLIKPLRARRLRMPAAGVRARARRVFVAGGVLAYPTESCFGLGCDPRQPAALARVLALKQRVRAKGLILIAAELQQLLPFIQAPAADDLRRFAEYWPGPFTLLLPASRKVHPWLRGRHNKIAVRITNHPQAAGLCRALGSALVSTSANRSGKISLKTAAACRTAFGSRAYTVPGTIGLARKPSTIVDYANGKILRA